MKSHPCFVYLFSVLLLSGCLSGTDPTAESPDEGFKYSESYIPPLFQDTERVSKIKRVLGDAVSFYEECKKVQNLPGLAYGVVVDDSLVISGGLGILHTDRGNPVTSTSLFRIASMTKSFTAMAILKLRDEGELSLSDPASNYIPELAHLTYLSSDANPVTIYNLLTMTAGFPEDNPWGDRFLDISKETLIAQVEQGVPFSSIPSQQFEYSNLGYG
jgi:CubicO group peptidase (beta-lactamase class C family)